MSAVVMHTWAGSAHLRSDLALGAFLFKQCCVIKHGDPVDGRRLLGSSLARLATCRRWLGGGE
eukprot:5860927-Prymnesium_polylepis.1